MIGIIGGSGFYDFLEGSEEKVIETPFGEVNYYEGQLGDQMIAFIPRHGRHHSIPPSAINYRANIYAAHLLNVEFIMATNAVGSCRKELGIGSMVLVDQILDFTYERDFTFFDGSSLKVTTRTGKQLSGVVHTDMSDPYDKSVRNKIAAAASKVGQAIIGQGTMVVTNGPRFETPAEIKAYAILGGDVAGMTSAPECFLARELEIPYATIALVTNYGAGLQDSVSAEEVFQFFKKQLSIVKDIFRQVILTHSPENH